MTLTKAEREQARREGWDVFNDCEIQRIDDPCAGEEGYTDPKFPGDAEAIAFVKYWAERGSQLHSKALEMVQ